MITHVVSCHTIWCFAIIATWKSRFSGIQRSRGCGLLLLSNPVSSVILKICQETTINMLLLGSKHFQVYLVLLDDDVFMIYVFSAGNLENQVMVNVVWWPLPVHRIQFSLTSSSSWMTSFIDIYTGLWTMYTWRRNMIVIHSSW